MTENLEAGVGAVAEIGAAAETGAGVEIVTGVGTEVAVVTGGVGIKGTVLLPAVFRIRIRRIHMFLGLTDPNPGSISKRYGSGFYNQAKKVPVRKTLIPTVL